MINPSPFDKLEFFRAIGYIPHAGQLKLHMNTARFRILTCGARWGKSTAASREAMAAMMKPESIGWIVSNSYELSSVIFKAVLYTWLDKRPEMVESYSESRMKIKLRNGSEAQAKSAANIEQLLAVGCDWMILDECALMEERAWQEFLQARLMDRKGWAMFTSTPKGKNWLYRLSMRARENHIGYYWQTGPSWENPIIDKTWLFEQKNNWTERYWKQEVLGEFLDDSGSVFKNIRSHITGSMEQYTPKKIYSIGVDLAKHQDWTVITVLDQNGHVCHWQRLDQETAWPTQKEAIKAVCRDWGNATCYVDSSGIGDPIVDDLQAMGVPVSPISTASVKTQLIDALNVALNNNKVTYPEIPVLLNELEVYEYDKSPTGKDRYNAPSGLHDDAVISLALAYRGIMRGSGAWGIPTKGL